LFRWVIGVRLVFARSDAGLLIVGRNDLERDGRVVIEAGKQLAAIDFHDHRRQQGTRLARSSLVAGTAALEHHAPLAAGGEFQEQFVRLARLVGDERPHLPDAGAGDPDGGHRSGLRHVAAFEEVEQPLFKTRHAANARGWEMAAHDNGPPEGGRSATRCCTLPVGGL
jgi:hypothetical protein